MKTRTLKMRIITTLALGLSLALATLGAAAQKAPAKKNPKAKKPPTRVYVTLDEARAAGPEIDLQGEYEGAIKGGGKIGVQVIALGKGTLQAVVHQGGLPGAGWNGETKIILDGVLNGKKASFAPPADPEKKKYIAASPAEFSAVNDPASAIKKYSATLAKGKILGKTDTGKTFTAKRIVRKSSTLGAKPPKNAIVLFDGSNKDAWEGGRVDAKRRVLSTDAKDILSKQNFNDYTIHLEFMLAFRPGARGQGRSNSGFYSVNRYEVQVLDSFGLDGKDNECGGIYKISAPKLNMCFPPLTWQTYDIRFRNARVDGQGKKTQNATLTVRHNGVLIQDKVEVAGNTVASAKTKEGTPGPLKLQGHGNPLVYRNIWIIEE